MSASRDKRGRGVPSVDCARAHRWDGYTAGLGRDKATPAATSYRRRQPLRVEEAGAAVSRFSLAHGRLPLSGALALAALLMFPGAALAAPPTLLSVGHDSQHPTATWSLPPGHRSDAIEVGTRTALDEFGEFPLRNFVDGDTVLEPGQTSWRSEYRLGGTYYVHASACGPQDPDCLEPEWSNILKLVIPDPARYAGRTSQGKRIRFTLFDGRIPRLTAGVKVRCRVRGRKSRTLPVTVGATPSDRITIRAGGFTDKGSFRVRGFGRWTITITGSRWEGSFRGTLRLRISARGLRCNSGKVKWKAR